MNSKWYKGIDPKDSEAKDAKTEEVRSYATAFAALDELLVEKAQSREYELASWSHKQADINGYNQAIREVKALIQIK